MLHFPLCSIICFGQSMQIFVSHLMYLKHFSGFRHNIYIVFILSVACLPAPNITCKDFSGNETQFTGTEIGFYKPVECRIV